jgi:DNA primase
MISAEKLTDIKSRLDRRTVLSLIEHIGYQVNRNGKFKLRQEERTPSSSVDEKGKITDFGSGWRGDIFALLQEYHGLTFPEACEYVEICLGGVR